MITDQYLSAHLKASRLELAVATTTALCRRAKAQHQLETGAALALGRLLSGVALVGLSQRMTPSCSLQVLSKGPAVGLYADVTEAGHLRGFIQKRDLKTYGKPGPGGRLSVGAGVLPATMFQLDVPAQGEHRQSSISMMQGEIDEDISQLLQQSSGSEAIVVSDLRFDAEGQILSAAGVYLHRLPDGDSERFLALSDALQHGGLLQKLTALEGPLDAKGLILSLAEDASFESEPLGLQLKCRCGHERAVQAFQLLEVKELMDMIAHQTHTQVNCEFCDQVYDVGPDDLLGVLDMMIKAEA